MPGRLGRPGLIATAARTAVIAGTAQAVTGNVARRQQERAAASAPPPMPAAPPPPAAPAPAEPAATADVVGALERLASLHASGALTDQEFAAAKAAALG